MLAQITNPKVFKCTYLNKKYFRGVPELNTELIPTKIDMKNTPKDDIEISWPPFVN